MGVVGMWVGEVCECVGGEWVGEVCVCLMCVWSVCECVVVCELCECGSVWLCVSELWMIDVWEVTVCVCVWLCVSLCGRCVSEVCE